MRWSAAANGWWWGWEAAPQTTEAAALRQRWVQCSATRQARPLCLWGQRWRRLRRSNLSGLHPALASAELVTMCDIDNPLCGPLGAAHVFAPQKGADPAMVELLDAGLAHLADVVERCTGRDIRQLHGAGAAGGMGGGMVAFFGRTSANGH
ncbi:MAG: glycerate kinase [Ruthenibacterium lactatiformans]